MQSPRLRSIIDRARHRRWIRNRDRCVAYADPSGWPTVEELAELTADDRAYSVRHARALGVSYGGIGSYCAPSYESPPLSDQHGPKHYVKRPIAHWASGGQ